MSRHKYQPTLDHNEKVERSMEQMRLAAAMSRRYYEKPLLVCYSGGKDSDALVELALASGAEFEVQHSVTTVDAPETMRHVKKTFGRLREAGVSCFYSRPKYKGEPITMWSLIPEKQMPPTRLVRYCCRTLKETGGAGRAIATGVRRSESTARRGRTFANNFSRARPAALDFDDAASLFEDPDKAIEHDDNFIRSCRIKGKTSFQPILEWTDDDVWQFLDEQGVETNPLYDEGFKRVGCIGCPFASPSERERERVQALAEVPRALPAGIREDARSSQGVRPRDGMGDGRGCLQMVDEQMSTREPITTRIRELAADMNWCEITDHIHLLHGATLDGVWLDAWHEAMDQACGAVDAVHARLEREAEGAGGPVPAEVVSDGSTDGATGYCRCGACHRSIDPWDRYCRHCGTEVQQ